MSIQTLYTAATGMQALETKLDVIANNLANINTTGFKKDRANFEDLFYRNHQLPGAVDSGGERTAVGVHVGLGAKVASVQSEFAQGSMKNTNRNLDVAVEGHGFVPVTDPNGDELYTRAGNFSLNANGQLVTGTAGTGRLVNPAITIPPDATDISISAAGVVSVRQPGSQSLNDVGQLQLSVFQNPEGLLKIGENLYAETDASAAPVTQNPGQGGAGVFRQGYLEASNVEPVEELIDLITTQRSFELNSQTVQAGDQILQLISNLRR